ncbi:MAG: hypothetical protein A3G59_01175 [Candidatus Taylorbacteria bacterium RIFCSPLOWO2_12_FULL_47_20]|uniref:Uncharacterized protein n=2 Tax=Candidatus Tayloriibacteriota TaxID=1817919 RepID=A0A1G2PD74_9BACT|nr:MAG: hypothetical protein A3H68_02710 [Candidatus Taylorbacteria bacterium RIFCSPLOWO2_02_FULL_46_40]OHA45572.1 MAG: hypothetical protein A3G59_01175 [Candidatus Taylorbacteria bacterium RIFCSPLOWO2_12_FULL_47_20]
MNNNKSFVPIVIVILAVSVLIVGGGITYYMTTQNTPVQRQPVNTPVAKISSVDISREISDKENWFVYRFTATCNGSSFDDPACKNLPSFEMKYPKHFDEALNQISGMPVQTKHNLTLGEGESYKTQFEACNNDWEIFDKEAVRKVIAGEPYCFVKNVYPDGNISYRYIKKVGNNYILFKVGALIYAGGSDYEPKVRTFLDEIVSTIKISS